MNRTDKMVMQFREVLKKTERFSSEEMLAYQQKLLTPLLVHAKKHVPFYRTRLDVVFDGDEIKFEKWNEIPLLKREEAQRRFRAMRARSVPESAGQTKKSETSGSMGRPLTFFSNEMIDVANLSMTDRLYRWWLFDGSKPMINFVPPRMSLPNSEETVTHGWRSGNLEGLNILRHSAGDIDRHIDWLLEKRIAYLAAYPNMIRALAQRTLERREHLEFEKIISRGWVVPKDTWDLCREAFGGQLIDQYGANEVGQIACQCPECGDYHVSAESILLEILDDEGNPVRQGETGRVVLTAFYNYAMPFIRYEIGDFAQVSGAVGRCTKTLPSINRIAGRYRNTFILHDGRVIYPNPPMSGFRKFLSYSQIQVVQLKPDVLEVRYVPLDASHTPDRTGLERWLKDELDPSFKVKTTAVDEIPNLPSGKYEDFLSLVNRLDGGGRQKQPAKATERRI